MYFHFSTSKDDDTPATCSPEVLAECIPVSQSAIAIPSTAHSGEAKRKADSVDSPKETVEPQKKIKWDCAAHLSDQSEAPPSPPEDKPQLIAAAGHRENRASVPSAERVPRDKCMYGNRCYR